MLRLDTLILTLSDLYWSDFEWMSLALSPEELQQVWVLKAIERMVTDMEKFPTEVFSDGGLYHAAHALRRIREATGN